MVAKASLNLSDREILDCLQDTADMPLAEIAKRVGLSTTPCWRRINRLQEPGHHPCQGGAARPPGIERGRHGVRGGAHRPAQCGMAWPASPRRSPPSPR